MRFIYVLYAFLFIFIGRMESMKIMNDDDDDNEDDKSRGNVNCKIYPQTFIMCRDLLTNSEFNTETKDIDDKAKMYTIKFDLNEAISKSTQFDLTVDSIQNGIRTNKYKLQGTFCTQMEEMAQKADAKLRSKMKPPIEDECEIKPGHYELNDFELDHGDLDTVLGQPDKLKVVAKLFNDYNKEFMCAETDVDVVC